MKSLILALAMLLGLAVGAEAHDDVVVVRDAFGRAVIVDRGFNGVVRGPVVVRDLHADPVVVRRGVNPFNQNGGRNRIGRRR